MDEEESFIKFDEVFENYTSGENLKFQQAIIDNTYQKASSKGNLAVLLSRKAFTRRERRRANCDGDARYKKEALSPSRLDAIKRAIGSIYPRRYGEEEKDWWRPFKQAINESCRRLNRNKKFC